MELEIALPNIGEINEIVPWVPETILIFPLYLVFGFNNRNVIYRRQRLDLFLPNDWTCKGYCPDIASPTINAQGRFLLFETSYILLMLISFTIKASRPSSVLFSNMPRSIAREAEPGFWDINLMSPMKNNHEFRENLTGKLDANRPRGVLILYFIVNANLAIEPSNF